MAGLKDEPIKMDKSFVMSDAAANKSVHGSLDHNLSVCNGFGQSNATNVKEKFATKKLNGSEYRK